jgi:TP901 family phage tail tape measure protein
MATVIKTTFSAIDKFTSVITKMTVGVQSFANKAVVAFNRIERAERKLRAGISNTIGKFGQLGAMLSGFAVMMVMAQATIDLDTNLASLSAITGVTGDQFKVFAAEIEAVSKSQKMFAGDTAKAFEIVGSVKPELLANAKALSQVTEAAMILSKATKMDLQTSTESLVGVMNQFNLGAEESFRTMNTLAAGSLAGSAGVDRIMESMVKFGSTANSVGVNLEASVALIEMLGEKSIYGSDAGTGLRNVLLTLSTIKALPKNAIEQLNKFGVNMDIVANNSLPVTDRLRELSKISGDSTAMFRVFGKENITVGQILLNNVGKIEELTKAVTGTNTAVDQANINSNTLSNRWTEVVNSFKNAITSTNSENSALVKLKNTLVFVADNMETLVKWTAIGIALFIAYKAAMLLFKGVMMAYNIVSGIATAAQWAWNAAMYANPIIWVVAIIIILIAVIAALIIWWEDLVKWVKESDNWFAKLIRASIYPLIKLFQVLGDIFDWIGEKWSQFINWIKTSDNVFAGFLRTAIEMLSDFGTVLGYVWDFIVWFIENAIKPLEDAFDRIGKVINVFSSETQKELGVNVNKTIDIAKPAGYNPANSLNPDASNQTNTNMNMQDIFAKIGIDINDKSGMASLVSNDNGIPVNVTKNLGWQ